MRPWERRLKDLAQLLKNCEATYFDPDLYRMNTNQFLQTARTVTFIIQKNKNTIPRYETWYAENVIRPWASDPLMAWAKNSRNQIEKEGDLDLYSSLGVSLIYSYNADEDISIPCGRDELVGANIQKLLRFAWRELPKGISDSAVVKIERRWVANTLPEWELQHALTYVYARLYDCSAALARYMGTVLDNSVPESTSFDQLVTDSRKVRFLKSSDLKFSRTTTRHFSRDLNFKPLPSFEEELKKYESRPKPKNLHQLVEYHANFARLTFEQFGNYIPTLIIFDKDSKAIDVISTQFVDQATKYIFWRAIADRILYLRASSIIWICESWIRNAKEQIHMPNKNLSVLGETLQVRGLNLEGETAQITWNILRKHGEVKPQLELLSPDHKYVNEVIWNYLIPIKKAFEIIRNPSL